MERLNDSLVKFVNADSIQNGMIFDPLWVVPRDNEIRVMQLIPKKTRSRPSSRTGSRSRTKTRPMSWPGPRPRSNQGQ